MIFVTGGTGFLGRYLIAELCRRNFRVRLLTRFPDAYPWLSHYPELDIIQGDIRDPAILADAVRGCEGVIHAGGLFSIWSHAGDFEAVNVQGTRNLLSAAQQAGVKHFVYVSTIAVIGQPERGEVIDEVTTPRPADPYQRSKLAAENVVLSDDFASIHRVIVRPGAYYGPLGNYAFNRLFFTDPMRGLIMQMDGGHYQIFPAYTVDVARGIVAAYHQGRSGEIYNLSGESLSHRAAFDIICEEANLRFPRLNMPGIIGINFARVLTALSRITGREPFYPIGLRSYVFHDWIVNSEKAANELGFAATPFREGARRTIDWYRAGKPDFIPEIDC